MLVLLRPADGRLYHLDFGEPTDVMRTPEQLVPWVMEDYESRRDHLWDIGPLRGQTELGNHLSELRRFPETLIPALLAMRFYAMPAASAQEVALCLDHENPQVRLAALGALGSMAFFPTAPRLKEFMGSADAAERREAANALSKQGTADAAKTLALRARRDPEFERAAAVARERHEIAQSGDTNLLVIPMLDSEDFEDLCIYAPFCANQIAAVLRLDSTPELMRQRAARVLGLTRQQVLGPIALQVFQEPSASLAFKRTLAWALGRVRYVKALPTLYEALAAARGEYELILLDSIGRMRRQTSLGVLLNHWDQHPTPAVQVAVRAALWRISLPVDADDEVWNTPAPVAEPTWVYVVSDAGVVEAMNPELPLEAELASSSEARRHDAMFGLAQLPRTEARRAILRQLATRDPSERVRSVALAQVKR